MYKAKFLYSQQSVDLREEDHLYFAYGSNLDPDRMAQRLGGAVEPVCIANLYGSQLAYNVGERGNIPNKVTFANVKPATMHHAVKGVVYRLTDSKIKELDQFEGGYSRWTVPVKVMMPICKSLWRVGDDMAHPISLGKKDILHIQIYLGNTKDIVEKENPSREYLYHLLKGAVHFSFPQRYIEKYILAGHLKINSAHNTLK